MSAWCTKCGHLASEGDYLLGVNEEVCWSCQAEEFKTERDALLALLEQCKFEFINVNCGTALMTDIDAALDAARGGK